MHILSFILLIFVVRVSASGECYHPGPAFPPADQILSKSQFDKLAATIDKVIKNVLDSPANWRLNTTSFAAQITSANETVWSHYYTAPILGDYKNSEPPSAVTGDSVFRVASVSKTFTVYAILLESKINLGDPITKYIPELLNAQKVGKDAPFQIDWDQITIRSLASQLSGIPCVGGLEDLAAAIEDPVALGFPPVDEGWEPPCLNNGTGPCDATALVNNVINRTRVFSANDRSSYSNMAFSLLGLALENATGKSYSDIIADSIVTPLGLENTRTTKPEDSAGIIPWGPNDWEIGGNDLGADTPSGGIYSTVNDLSKYLRSILSSSLLPIATRNAWMKPQSWMSSGSDSAYGMPWEIKRATKATPDGRPIDLIIKGGSMAGYKATIGFIPEFGLGVTILVAGEASQVGTAMYDVRERIYAALIPEIDRLIRDEVAESYGGMYALWDEWFGPPNMKWSFKLEVDDTGPGLRLVDWKSNDTNFLPLYGALRGMPADPELWEARLLPTGVYGSDEVWQVEVWRLNAIPKRKSGDDGKVFDEYCITMVDALMYAGNSVEEFYVIKSNNIDNRPGLSEAGGVFMPAWKELMMLRWTDNNGVNLSHAPEKLYGAGRRFGSDGDAQKPLFD